MSKGNAIKNDIAVLRDVVKHYLEICRRDSQNERRELWRKHNSLIRTRPLVLVQCNWGARNETPAMDLRCVDPFFQWHEKLLRWEIYQDTIGDDCIFEPWITQAAKLVTPLEPPADALPDGVNDGLWGVRGRYTPAPQQGGAWKYDPPIRELKDVAKLIRPRHLIDEEATRHAEQRLQDAVGDLIAINVRRAPAWSGCAADISTHLGYLRGLDQIMLDMLDNPQWLHGLLAFMRDGILEAQAEAEVKGDWRLCDHENQAMPYAQELPSPAANSKPVARKQLWVFMSAQEFTLVSPEMHDEFMLRYQLPIIEKFGLCAYGCCEDLTKKIDMLRKIPNLRRIAVTPWADVGKCAEHIRQNYVLSWRPNPAMVSYGFDAAHIRKTVEEALNASKGCHVDITLKDIETVGNDPWRLKEWVRIVRDVADEF